MSLDPKLRAAYLNILKVSEAELSPPKAASSSSTLKERVNAAWRRCKSALETSKTWDSSWDRFVHAFCSVFGYQHSAKVLQTKYDEIEIKKVHARALLEHAKADLFDAVEEFTKKHKIVDLIQIRTAPGDESPFTRSEINEIIDRLKLVAKDFEDQQKLANRISTYVERRIKDNLRKNGGKV